MDLVERYERWINNRAARLSRMFGVDMDDARQELTLNLIRFESQKTAWLETSKTFSAKGLALYMGDPATTDDFPDVLAIVENVFSKLENDTQVETFRMLLDGRSPEEICETLDVGPRTFRRMSLLIRDIIGMEE